MASLVEAAGPDAYTFVFFGQSGAVAEAEHSQVRGVQRRLGGGQQQTVDGVVIAEREAEVAERRCDGRGLGSHYYEQQVKQGQL